MLMRFVRDFKVLIRIIYALYMQIVYLKMVSMNKLLPITQKSNAKNSNKSVLNYY